MKNFIVHALIILSSSLFAQTQHHKVNWSRTLPFANSLPNDDAIKFDSSNMGYLLLGQNALEKFNPKSGKSEGNISFSSSYTIYVQKFFVYDDGSFLIYGEEEDSTGDKGLFLAKYNAQFSLEWQVNHNGNTGRSDVAIDLEVTDSAIYVCGVLNWGNINQNSQVWLAKYSPNGSKIWEDNVNGSRSKLDRVNDLAVNYLGEVFITGATSDYSDMFLGEGIRRFLTKYDQSGNRVWNKKSAMHYAGMGPPPIFSGMHHNDDEGFLLAVDSQHVFLAEHYYEGFVPSSHPYYQGSMEDRYGAKISKYNFNGGLVGGAQHNQSNSASYKRMFQDLQLDGDYYYYSIALNGIRSSNNDINFIKRDKANSLIYNKDYTSFYSFDFIAQNNEVYVSPGAIVLTPFQISLKVSRLDSAGNIAWNFDGASTNDNPMIGLDNFNDPYIRTNNRRLRKLCTSFPQVNIINTDTSICIGDTIPLSATANGDLYYWNTQNGLSDSSSLSPLAFPFSSRVYTLTTAYNNGCKSTASINIQTRGSEQHVSLCSNDSLVFRGQVYNTSGTYYDTISSAGQCDSIIKLNLEILPAQSSTYSASICTNDSLFFNNSYLSIPGVYHDTLQSASGCDSMVSLNLTINTIARDTSILAACENYYWALTGDTLFNSGYYSDTLSGGCDSIQVLNLTIYQNTSQTQHVSACGSFYWSANQTIYTQTGIYTHVLQSHHGCDSSINLNLTVNTLTNQVTQPTNGTLMASQSNAQYQWFECSNGFTLLPNDTNQILVVPQSGNYAVEIINGSCMDTSLCTNVILTNLEDHTPINAVRVYPNPFNNQLRIEFQKEVEQMNLSIYDIQSKLIRRESLVSKHTILDLSSLKPGLYFVYLNEQVYRIVKK